MHHLWYCKCADFFFTTVSCSGFLDHQLNACRLSHCESTQHIWFNSWGGLVYLLIWNSENSTRCQLFIQYSIFCYRFLVMICSLTYICSTFPLSTPLTTATPLWQSLSLTGVSLTLVHLFHLLNFVLQSSAPFPLFTYLHAPGPAFWLSVCSSNQTFICTHHLSTYCKLFTDSPSLPDHQILHVWPSSIRSCSASLPTCFVPDLSCSISSWCCCLPACLADSNTAIQLSCPQFLDLLPGDNVHSPAHTFWPYFHSCPCACHFSIGSPGIQPPTV